MAGDWIKFETATPDKPEIWLIAEAAGIDPDAAVGKLLRIWIWFDQHTETANAPSVSKLTLDRLVGVSGFCDYVISAGWMHEKNGQISLPNFDRHNGKTAKNRALTAKRVAKHAANAKLTPQALPREEKRRVLPPKSPASGGLDAQQVAQEDANPRPRLNGQARTQISNTRGPDQLAKVISRLGLGNAPAGMDFNAAKQWAIRKVETMQ